MKKETWKKIGYLALSLYCQGVVALAGGVVYFAWTDTAPNAEAKFALRIVGAVMPFLTASFISALCAAQFLPGKKPSVNPIIHPFRYFRGEGISLN